MTSVLLFGGSGFLGGFVRQALASDRRVRELSVPGRERCDLVAGSVADLAELLASVVPDVVINCVGRLDGSPAELVLANTLPTAKLIEATAMAVPSARLIRIGSAGEYGAVPHGTSMREDGPADPVSAYGVSHLAATGLLRRATEAGVVEGVTLRVFNPIGPGGGQTVLGTATRRLVAALASGADHITMGRLTAYRDFVDVRDVAAAVVAATVAERPAMVCNVGSGRSVSTRQAVECLAKRAGFAGEIREAASGSDRSAAVDWSLAALDRATTSLHWEPTIDLANSVAAIWGARASRQRPGPTVG